MSPSPLPGALHAPAPPVHPPHDEPRTPGSRALPDLLPGLDQVALVAWPDDAARREALAAEGRPRLLVIDELAPPPLCWDDREDWIRHPVDPADLRARAAALLGRPAQEVGAASARGTIPVLDADGLLRAGADWVALPPIEARLVACLLHRPGLVVPRHELEQAGWPHGTPGGRLLDNRIKHLRKRLDRFGLEIHTVRGTGYLLALPS